MTKAWKYYLLLYIAALVVRASVFYWTIEPHQRYRQPDSNDYHYAALCMTYGYGMHSPEGNPLFWRTPGYPAYLSLFYNKNYPKSGEFAAHAQAQRAAIWVQILLCSLVPLLVFQLALLVTGVPAVAWITAIISIFHLGFVLASTYLLTDGLAMLLFMLFLIFVYKGLQIGRIRYFIGAAVALAAYTWMRPMGQFVALATSIICICFSKSSLNVAIKRALIFLACFAMLIFPWFWRNYKLTGSWFFCPLFGLYFNVFNAPKILSRVKSISLKQAHQELTQAAGYLTAQEKKHAQLNGDQHVVCGELVCLQTAWPLIAAHPWYFAWDWFVEVCKTTFDLYASQLAAFAGNCFTWDPLIEYLDEKILNCLYRQAMPIHWRMIAWLECIGSILLWIGIVGGFWSFVVKRFFVFAPFDTRANARTQDERKHIKTVCSSTPGYKTLTTNYLTALIFIGSAIIQTGGFGYARLRLPIEPLMLILGVTYWWWIITNPNKKS